MLRGRADVQALFNVKTARWLNPLRSVIWLSAKLLMLRMSFTARWGRDMPGHDG
jgi:hypothetical protein